MNKLTVENFEMFQNECDKWLNRFGLTGWDVGYYFEFIFEALANCDVPNLEDRVCMITLASKWPRHIEVTESMIKKVAFHEVCELLLARMGILGESRYVSEVQLREATHEVIRTLETAVFY